MALHTRLWKTSGCVIRVRRPGKCRSVTVDALRRQSGELIAQVAVFACDGAMRTGQGENR